MSRNVKHRVYTRQIGVSDAFPLHYSSQFHVHRPPLGEHVGEKWREVKQLHMQTQAWRVSVNV